MIFLNGCVFLCLNGYFQQETGVKRIQKIIDYNFVFACPAGACWYIIYSSSKRKQHVLIKKQSTTDWKFRQNTGS